MRLRTYLINVGSMCGFVGIASGLIMLSGCMNQPAYLSTHIQAAHYLNPNKYHQEAPVVVVLYQLKSSASFSHANFFSLYNEPEKTLGADLLDKRELEIRPNQQADTKQLLAPGTAYIGVVAGYRHPDQAQWRQIIPLSPDSKGATVNIALQTQGVIAQLK